MWTDGDAVARGVPWKGKEATARELERVAQAVRLIGVLRMLQLDMSTGIAELSLIVHRERVRTPLLDVRCKVSSR